METKGTNQADLKDELPELLELDELRKRATELRNKGIKGLLKHGGDKAAWDETDPHAAADVLLNRVKAKAAVLDLFGGEPHKPEWPVNINPRGNTKVAAAKRTKHWAETRGAFPKNPVVPDHTNGFPLFKDANGAFVGNKKAYEIWVDDKLAVFTAAYHLRARLDYAGAVIDPEFIFCLYTALRELYSIGEPDWTFGGARAGVNSRASSTFVTMEVARGVGNLESRLRNTAVFLRILAKHTNYISQIEGSREGNAAEKGRREVPVLPLANAWCNAEVERVATGILSLCYEYEEKTMFDLPSAAKKELEDIDRKDPEEVCEAVRSFLHSAARMVDDYIYNSLDVIEACDGPIERWRQGEKGHLDRKKDESGAMDARSASAHALFLHRMNRVKAYIGSYFPKDRKKVPEPEKTPKADKSWELSVFLRAAEVFERSGVRVKGLLVPVYGFMTNRVNTILLRSEEEGEVSHAQELAFAVSCASTMSMNEHQPSFKKAKELLENAIDQEGVIPPGPAFYESDDDTVRIPNNAHTIGAMAQLMTNPSYKPCVQTVRRMVQYFEVGIINPGSIGGAAKPDPNKLDAWVSKRVAGDADELMAWSRSRLTGVGDKGTMWITCVNILALDRIVRMLDAQINARVLAHFNHKSPASLGTRTKMDELMCSDIGLACLDWERVGRKRKMLTYDMEKLRRWLVPRTTGDRDPMSSMILYGPPGTGKTTIVEGLAASAAVPMVEITPSQLIIRGTEAVEVQTAVVMRALSLLTRVVILFDEFDTVIADRDQQKEVKSIFSFLTAAMLPKLADLNKAAKGNHFVYVLATNYIDRLDAAAIRPGRFDHKRGVYPPDLASRMCRMVSQLTKWKLNKGTLQFSDGWEGRVCEVMCKTAGAPMERLVMPGWFRMPPKDDRIGEGEPQHAFEYIARGGNWKKYRYPLPMDLGIDENVNPTEQPEDHTPQGEIPIDAEAVIELDPTLFENYDQRYKPLSKEDKLRLASRNNLVSDQAIELAIVGRWNRSAAMDFDYGLSWGSLTAISGSENMAKALVDAWDEIEKRTRNLRLEQASRVQLPKRSLNSDQSMTELLAEQNRRLEKLVTGQAKQLEAFLSTMRPTTKKDKKPS